ncbi:MAG: hypothetical protein P1U42_08300 [Phycisphaerales bacterium]|nr:hypothetical protein [Phycisphaerales bacterium]
MHFLTSTIPTWVRHRAGRLTIAALALCIVVGALLIFVISGLNNTPKWWSKSDVIVQGDSIAIETAEQLENALSTQLTLQRDQSQPRWAVAITEQQANSWLAIRLIETVETHLGDGAWPSNVDRVRIGLNKDQMLVGARVKHTSGSMILWSSVNLIVDDQGDLYAEFKKVQIGSTAVPKWVVDRLTKEYQFSNQSLKIGTGSIDLGDGRETQLIGAQVRGDQLELVLETRIID